MREPVAFTTEVGPHKGWVRFLFETQGRPWSLLTIDNPDREPPFSYLSPKDNVRANPWPHYHIDKFDGILSVEAAVLVISRIYTAYSHGIDQGQVEAKAAFRKAIGL